MTNNEIKTEALAIRVELSVTANHLRATFKSAWSLTLMLVSLAKELYQETKTRYDDYNVPAKFTAAKAVCVETHSEVVVKLVNLKRSVTSQYAAVNLAVSPTVEKYTAAVSPAAIRIHSQWLRSCVTTKLLLDQANAKAQQLIKQARSNAQ